MLVGGIDMLNKIKAKIRGTIDLDRLKKDGLVYGKNFHAQEGTIIDPGHCWLIEIGDNVTLAPRVHILAHDASTKIPLGYTKIGRVTIGSNVFIGTGSIIMPNVKIGDNVIIGAMSLVTRDILSGGVYAGNPCARISDYDEWIAKHHDRMNKSKVYDKTYTIGNISNDQKQNMKRELESRIGYVE